jgi:hypothetical protein
VFTVAKTTWLQVTGQTPRPFKTKKAATEAFTLELERFTAEGWLKAWGTLASGVMVLKRAGTLTALVVSTVDAEGYDTDPLFTHRRMSTEAFDEFFAKSRKGSAGSIWE